MLIYIKYDGNSKRRGIMQFIIMIMMNLGGLADSLVYILFNKPIRMAFHSIVRRRHGNICTTASPRVTITSKCLIVGINNAETRI